MRLPSLKKMQELLDSPPVLRHSKKFDDPVFGNLGTVWYFGWLRGIRDYLVSRKKRIPQEEEDDLADPPAWREFKL